MVWLQKECSVLVVARRPLIFAPPFSRHLLQIRVRRPPMLHVNHQPWIMLHSGVPPLEPVIEPPHRLVSPLHSRSEIGVVGEGMIPWSNYCFHRPLRSHQHVHHIVAISVLHSSYKKTGNGDLAERAHTVTPERAIVLML